MANNDNPRGLQLIQRVSGAGYNTRKVTAPSTYATALFIGEAVTLTGTANATAITTGQGSYNIGTLPEVNKTAAGDGNAITGVILSFDQDPDNPNNQYGAASTERVMTICDDPNALYEIQADGTLAVTQMGLNAVLIDTHTGDTNTGLAGTELDTTSDVPAADASNQLTIIAFSDKPDNDPASANSKVIVRINNHTNVPGVVGI